MNLTQKRFSFMTWTRTKSRSSPNSNPTCPSFSKLFLRSNAFHQTWKRRNSNWATQLQIALQLCRLACRQQSSKIWIRFSCFSCCQQKWSNSIDACQKDNVVANKLSSSYNQKSGSKKHCMHRRLSKLKNCSLTYLSKSFWSAKVKLLRVSYKANSRNLARNLKTFWPIN